jgi:hypothetical protein
MKEPPCFLTCCAPIMDVRRASGLLPLKLGADIRPVVAPEGTSDDFLLNTDDHNDDSNDDDERKRSGKDVLVDIQGRFIGK